MGTLELRDDGSSDVLRELNACLSFGLEYHPL